MSSAAEVTLPKRRYNKLIKPYWNTALKDLHENMRALRHHPSFRRYKDSKREFRQRLRQAARLHEQEEFSRIKQLSQLDQKGFWKVISSRKPKKRSSGRELVFGDSRAKTNDAILKGWTNHFEHLYCPSNEYSYDNQFKHEVEKTVLTCIQRTDHEVPISYLSIEELTEIVRALMPTNNSASCNNITYEHIKYGGEAL